MTAENALNSTEFEVFYDGGCPLCRREIAMLKRWDRRQRVRFTDIDALEFQAAALGKSQQELMASIHGRLPNGDWVTGVEVFRRLYAAAGFGPVVALTRLPLIAPLLDWGYRLFARNRLRVTGRCTADRCGV
jgi:predicted DCC family thiol-disulfide oxidoreductase YuxK